MASKLMSQDSSAVFNTLVTAPLKSGVGKVKAFWRGEDNAGPGVALRGVQEIIMSANTIQESMNRKLYLQARLDRNLQLMGDRFTKLTGKSYESINDLIPVLRKSGKLNPEVRGAILDAYDYSMHNTFAKTFDKGIFGWLSHAGTKPWFTAMVSPFPRFMANLISFQLERNPAGVLNLFSAEYRKALSDGGWKGQRASDQLAKSIGGIAQMSASWGIRNSPIGGPEYYQISKEHTNGAVAEALGFKTDIYNDKFWDVRALPGMSQMLAVGEMLKWFGEGRPETPSTFSTPKFLDAFLGLRSLSESPMFNFAYWVNQLDNPNSEAGLKVLYSTIGNYLAGFARPLKSMELFYGKAQQMSGQQPTALHPQDIKGEELLGPTRDTIERAIPGARGVGQAFGLTPMPERMSPTSGKPVQVESPMFTLIGVSESTIPKIKQMFAKNGITENDLVGNHGNATANNLIAFEMSKDFTAKISSDNAKTLGILTNSTVGDALVHKFGNKKLNEFEIQKLMKVVEIMRSRAKKSVRQDHPKLFISDMISNQSGVTPEIKQRERQLINRRMVEIDRNKR
jgi:hypothetical protein